MDKAKTEESMQGTTLPYKGRTNPLSRFCNPYYGGMLITQFYPLPSSCNYTKKE